MSSPRVERGDRPGDWPAVDVDSARSPGDKRRASMTALVVLLASVVMIFAAFSSALIVRRGLGGDWIAFRIPAIVWWNSAALTLSSVLVEHARRGLRSGRRAAFNVEWSLALALGVSFLAGQGWAWRQLQQSGILIASNPSASFFYILTAAHAAHLLGGVAALAYIAWQAWRLRLGPGKRTGVDVASIYWHFMGGLWFYLLALFVFWS